MIEVIDGQMDVDLTKFVYDDFEEFAICMRNKGISPDSITKYRSAMKSHYRDHKWQFQKNITQTSPKFCQVD